MAEDYPDYTELFQLVGSDITLPINIEASTATLDVAIQSSAVTFNVTTPIGEHVDTDIVSSIRLDINIAAQTVDTIGIDIKGQTLGNLAIDIAGQTIEQLNVNIAASAITLNVDVQNAYFYVRTEGVQSLRTDIVAQTVGSIGIDIKGQTVGNINVNLAGSDITMNINLTNSNIMLPVDIQAQYVTLNIDIVAQSVGSIDINIAAQSLGTVNINIKEVAAGVTLNIGSITGTCNIKIHEAQDVGIYLQPEWAAKQGYNKLVCLLRSDVPSGSGDSALYEVPADKTFYVCAIAGSCYGGADENRDKNHIMNLEVYDATKDEDIVLAGGNGGASMVLPVPATVPGEHIIGFAVWNESNFTCNLGAVFLCYET